MQTVLLKVERCFHRCLVFRAGPDNIFFFFPDRSRNVFFFFFVRSVLRHSLSYPPHQPYFMPDPHVGGFQRSFISVFERPLWRERSFALKGFIRFPEFSKEFEPSDYFQFLLGSVSLLLSPLIEKLSCHVSKKEISMDSFNCFCRLVFWV